MISLIVAMDRNNLIGKGNDLAWHYPEDLKYFKEITTGKSVIMGYNTYLSIYNRIKKPLPNRINYVITYEDKLPGNPNIVKGDIESFLKSWEENELVIIGGKSIYEWLAKYADKIYLTRIEKDHDGDVYLNLPLEDFELVNETPGIDPDLKFQVFMRK